MNLRKNFGRQPFVTNDLAQLTPTQVTTRQELQAKLMREFDTDALRQMVLDAETARMLEANVYRGLVRGDW